jgi:hypothetical protein
MNSRCLVGSHTDELVYGAKFLWKGTSGTPIIDCIPCCACVDDGNGLILVALTGGTMP